MILGISKLPVLFFENELYQNRGDSFLFKQPGFFKAVGILLNVGSPYSFNQFRRRDSRD